MLEMCQLSCMRGIQVLFEDLSFTIFPGDLVQVQGSNGTGKTTLLRIIAGLKLAESGDVLWYGNSIYREKDEFSRELLFLGHITGVKRDLTAYENLAFYQKMHGVIDEVCLCEALIRVGLVGREDVPAAKLSAGQNRRIALARLWISTSKLWILDEPLTSIDKEGVKVLEYLFQQHVDNGGMVIFTTHQDIFEGNTMLRRVRLGV
ncbi:cytochrome c biogenesis heme-transporting ATPase CcmA [Candidatus Enterovibrio escicola]|uniref:ABC transporter involved in cytochrome c biogenesis, ATPase component CcmA n=1 Tax=Candidatus Enterovibrio escicola TaxID=1927127 RepID=A0A2A5T1J2_9GAMM|nr:cytochrome c biogenesis heme-transporting ATPase CcmA [Candidatus Enterovibrio escacola]PCS22016.1 ABC transporter involved in cytochrome c biogenesis, ATPase component CcmA [Candidatus Enterovibrio escacola]